jgi:5'-methylthioadenosine phosphorylase
MALVTDYDCWHAAHEAVTVEGIIATLNRNVTLSKRVIRAVVPSLMGARACSCSGALASAVITSKVSPAVRRRLHLLLGQGASTSPPTARKK